MKISKQAKRAAKELFSRCQANGMLDENRVRLAVRGVVEKKPRGYLAILSHFQRLLRLELDRHSARIESAIPLPPELQAAVQSNLARRHGAGLKFSFVDRPALIGGLRVRVGSDVYDGSVAGRLAALGESF